MVAIVSPSYVEWQDHLSMTDVSSSYIISRMSYQIPQIGKKLRAAREAKKLTQQAVADFLGKDRIAVSNWENDKNLPEVSALFALGEMYSLSLDELLGRDAGYIVTKHEGKTVIVEMKDFPAKEEPPTYNAIKHDATLIRELLAGLLGPLGLRLKNIDIDCDRGLSLQAAWGGPPREHRRGLQAVSGDPAPPLQPLHGEVNGPPRQGGRKREKRAS